MILSYGTGQVVVRHAVFWMFFFCSGVLWAQQPNAYPLGGGFLGTGSLEASASRVENYFYEADAGVAATGYRLRPTVGVRRGGNEFSVMLNGQLEYSGFDLPGSFDSYLDYDASGSMKWRPYTKHGFEVSGSFRRGHDQPGLVRTEAGAFGGEIDEWRDLRGGLQYRYGSPGSPASNELTLSVRDREYLTNRNDTRILNYSTGLFDYVLSYDYSPRTTLLFNVGYGVTDYTIDQFSNGFSRNGEEVAVRLGLSWLATARTSGRLLVGARSYSVEDRSRPSRESLAWRANVDWSPFDATTLQISTAQSTVESYRADTLYIDERGADLSWRQVWSTRLTSELRGGLGQSRFVGSGRRDDAFRATAAVNYLLRRDLTAFASIASRNRDSNQVGREYHAPEARIGLRWTP